MYDKESIAKEKCKSRLFKGIAGWCARHGAVLAAFMLIAVSAVLGTFETKLVYGGTLSYGQNGTTSSPTYKGGSGNNPTVHEPGVIGVSVVTYDMNKMGNSGLKYGARKDNASSVSSTNKLEDINDAITAYGKNEGASVWKQNNGKDYGHYPYWTRVGYTKKGEPIYTYSNVLKHAITQNMLSMQTARSFNESTLVFVPEAVASSNHLSWIKKLNQHVIGKSTKNSNKFAIFYDLNPAYKDTDSERTKYANVLKSLHSMGGIYYSDLKSYLKKHEKKKTGKEFLEITEDGKKYDVCNYSRFSEMKKKSDLDAIIGYKKNSKGKYVFTSTGKKKLEKARMLYSSATNIAEPQKNSYISTPDIFLIFLRTTTAMTLGHKKDGTQMFSFGGCYEGIYGEYGKGNNAHTNSVDVVSETVIRNLFTTDKTLEKYLDRQALNYKSMRSQLKREVLNNEYNTHYLDLLFSGYALARASGDADAVTKWSDAIFAYAGSAANDSESMKNVVIRLDTGMVYGTSKDVTYVSTGDVINKHYGLSKAGAYEENKITNKKSLSKGFIGFAAPKDKTNQNYQAFNQEIASKKGVVKASDYNKTYGDYYTRLENAINSTGVAVNSDNYSWYGTMMAARATTKEYFKSSKNKKATSKVANKLSVVSLLKMKASPSGATSTSTKEWNYGTYAIDGYAWKDVTENDSVKFNLAIYSTKANKKAPSTNGKNIKDTFQSATVDVTGDNSTVTDDVYVKLTPDKDKDSKALFAKMLSSNKYYVKVVFEDGTGKTVKTLDGKSSKTVKEIKGGTTSQQKKYAAALNQYDDTNKGSEKGDEQNYNKLVSAKQIGGKDLQTNNCLIWRISNSKVRTDGLKISAKSSKYVNWKAKVYIYKKSGSGASTIWTNVLSGKQVKGKTVKASDMGNGDYTETNSVIAQYIGKESNPEDDKDVNLSGTYESTPEAYAELKEGSVYNETFEAMAGTPSTRSLYFATGGSEFIVNMQAVYDDYNLDEVGGNKNSYRSTRTYKSIFKGVDCEYKKGDTLKSLAAGGSTTETFVSDNQDKKSEKTITVEKNNAVNPTGASSYSTDIKAHNATTKFEATWTGTITNSTPEPKDVGKFKPGKAGSPCAGKGFDKGTQRTKATAETNWSVDAYNNALDQAFSWAKKMEQIGGSPDGTAWRIADSDGYKRIYDVGDAVITVTMSGGSKSNAIECGSSASFSKNGTYTSSQKSSATVKSNDSGVLGSGYSYTKGQFGKGSGYHAGAHGHGGSCPGNDKQTGTDAKGNPIMGPCGDEHNCGSFTPGTDITYGPSATINYTIKVTFKNGTIDAKNYDGNVGESGLNVVKQTGLTQFDAHAMCGACCEHVLPQIEDVWTQKLRFDTIRFTNLKVWKLHSGYVQGMSEIRQTDSGTGTGIEGADGAAEAEEIKKQKEEAEKNEVHIDPDVSTEEGEVIDSDAKYDENGDLIIPDFEISGTDPDPDDLTEADSDETWNDGSEDSEEIDIVKSKIVRYDPNIFYNIAQADTSKAGRIRYSLQTGQDDTVTWMEFDNKNNEHRTDYCDGQTASHGNSPVKVTANGHKKSWCKGCLYGYHDDATALASGKKNLANRHDNANSKGEAGTVADTKTAYSADKTDKVDKQSFEWKRFDERRKLNCRATVISDFLILQTSSGNESILYYEDTVGTEHNQCQENYKDDLWYSKPTDMNNVKKQNVAKATQMWNDKMWTSNPLVKKVTSLNVGSYNGNYSSTSTKYQGTGGEATVKTAFDKDEIEYNSIMDCKETVNGNRGETLNKARVTSARRIETEAEQLSQMSTSMQDNNIDPNKCSPGCGNTYGGVNFDTYGNGSARMGKNTASVYVTPTKEKVWGKYSWIDRIDPAINGQASVPEPALFGNAGLVLLQDGIAQCPTNRNKEYVTGQSSAFFIPLITYVNPGADKRADEHDVADYEFKYNDAEDPVLHVIGYTMDSIYTNGQTKVNNIVVHDPVSVKGAAILAVDGSMDQRVLGTDKSGAAEMNKEANSETCPGTAQECQYRLLNCQFGKQIRKAAFSINNARRNESTDEDTGVTSSYDSIVSDILSDGGSYMDVSLADSGYSIKRYDGKEAFEGVSENDTNQPDRYLYGDGKASLPMTWSAMGADVESTKSDTYELQGVFTFRDNIQTAKALFTTRATKLLTLSDGTVQIACADGSVYTSKEHALSGSGKNTIQYKFGLDSVMLAPKTIDYKGKSYTIDANTTVTVNGQKLSFVQSTAATSDMSNYIGDGIWIGNQDDVDEENVNAYNTAYACNYNVDNLAVTRLAPEKAENGISYKHTLSCFAAVKTHSKTTQDYYNGVDDNVKVEPTVKVDKTFEYTGSIQTITLKPGTYTLETWGAQGGNCGSYAGGEGGYSSGKLKVTQQTTLYIAVGERGHGTNMTTAYNGGGGGNCCGSGGGGATSIATADGQLKDLANNKNAVLLVAGGGGGASSDTPTGNGKAGGSAISDPGEAYPSGKATQMSGNAFGIGGTNTYDAAGGGGGYYGGYAAASGYTGGWGGGGSGYAASSLTNVTGTTGGRAGNGLVKISGGSSGTQASIDWTRQKDNGLSKQTGENNVHEHSEDCLSEASKGFQIAVNNATAGDTTDLEKMLGATVWNQIKSRLKECYASGSGSGSGSGDVSAGQVYTYNYTGGVQSVTLPAGKYKLESWGASGGGRNPGNGGYSTGTVELNDETTLYITVGQQAGTFNGGGYGCHGSGGGATHIATINGQLSTLSNNKGNILLVAGGGAGGSYGRGGSGGGANQSGTGGGSGCGTAGMGATINGPGTSYYSGSFGAGASNYGWNTCGGGGGYYGGGGSYENYSRNDDDDAGGGGGSGYAAPSLTNVSGITGEHSGNGLAKITVLEAHTDLDPDKVFSLVKQVVGTNYNLIPNTVTTNGMTIVNPFWKCKCIFNKHVCDKNCTTDYVLQCKEPHHKTQLEGGKEVVQHYEAGNEICYDACHNDELHKNASGVVNKGEDGKKKAVDFGDFILLDNYFYVYFPNVGDFYDSDSYGIYQTQQNKGKGYQDNFDTTEWTREKWIKFPYSVLYNRNGVWEEHQADEWFQLEIVDTVQNNTVNNECYNLTGLTNKQDTYTYQFYCQLDNEEMSGASVEFAVEAINNQGSPYGSENPYGRDGVFSLDCEEDNSSTMNRDRLSDLTADHSAYKKLFIDVVGRIGNLLFEDTTDVRFSNLFKKNEDGWLIDGIVHKVDKTVQNMYMSWHLNNNDTSVDIRGQKVSSYNEWYNTWNTAKWTDVGDNAGKCVSTPLEAAKNSIKALRSEQMQLGYNLLWDIQTMGSYAGGNVQITPYYYALDTKTDELIPLDVYISNDEDTQLINEFGLMDTYGTDYFETRSKDLFDYAMYLNWNEEKERRNYGNDVNAEGKVTEKSATETASKVLGRVVLNADGTPMTRKNPVTGMDEEITAPMTIPMGDDYRLGNVQFLRLDDRAKTFLGNSQVTALHNDIKSVLYPNGSNDQELFHEFDQIGNEIGKNEITEDYYSFRVQRWHATLGLPSSAKFTAVKKDENGKAVHTDPYTLIDGEDGNKIYAYQQFDADYLREHNDSSRYLILETASITAYGAIYDLQYSQGANNGRVSTVVDGKVKTYDFVDIADKDPSVKEKGIPINTLFAVYGMTNSGRDYETLQTH